MEALGARQAKVRKQATEELTKFGRKILPPIKELLLKTDDPEVAARCQDVIDVCEPSVTLQEREKTMDFLRGLSFKDKEACGKRFIISISRSQLQNTRMNIRRTPETHMFEMAPGVLFD
jgi:hypothetical protein